jgi:hypothetical protein
VNFPRRLHRQFARLAGCAALVLAAFPGRAQAPAVGAAPVVAKSVSGQFIVHGLDVVLPKPGREIRPVGNDPVIELRPDLLTVSCERIKRAVLTRLDLKDGWHGKIHLHLHRQPAIERPVAIRPRVFRDGWQFHVALPDKIEWTRLVRAVTEVVLLEIANRDNGSTVCAQPPLWLAEGMDALIIGEHGRKLTIESQTSLNRSSRRPDPLRDIRAALAGQEPAGFSDLTLATVEQLVNPAEFARFRANAALLVHALTAETRRQRTVEFLRNLSAALNWQTPFLHAHRAEIANLLEAEKWWAVTATHELAQDPALFWPPGQVVARLEEILRESAAVRAGGATATETLPLAKVITDWEFAAQRPVLERKLAQLQLLLMRTPPEPAPLRPLITDCFRTLDRYLAERGGANAGNIGRGDVADRTKVLLRTTARRVETLSRQAASLRR